MKGLSILRNLTKGKKVNHLANSGDLNTEKKANHLENLGNSDNGKDSNDLENSRNLNTEKNSKGLTEIVFILDRSGSMTGLEEDTIGGFNSLIEKQKKEEGRALISTVLFDNEIEVLHDRVPIKRIQAMTKRDYYVRGCTALLDAIGGAICHIGNIHKYAREEDRPDKTLFVITTDGLENASKQYSYDKVKQMVERQKKCYGWEFLFLGANMDALEVAGRFGISKEYAANYHCDEKGMALNYQVLNEAICQVRMGSKPLSGKWKAKIDEDFQRRKGSLT